MGDDIRRTRTLLEQAQKALEAQNKQVLELTGRVTTLLKVKEAAEKAVASLKELKVEYDKARKELEAAKKRVSELEAWNAQHKEQMMKQVRQQVKQQVHQQMEKRDAEKKEMEGRIVQLLREVHALKDELRAQGTPVEPRPSVGGTPTAEKAVSPAIGENDAVVKRVRNKACNECLRLKTRCSGLEPCQQCLKRETSCEYKYRLKGFLPGLPQSKKRKKDAEDGGGAEDVVQGKTDNAGPSIDHDPGDRIEAEEMAEEENEEEGGEEEEEEVESEEEELED